MTSIFVTSNAQHIIVPWREDLAAMIPHGRRMKHNGQDLLLVPNGRDEARLCRNVGVQVPSPILTRYDWAGQKPWDVQKTTAALLSESTRAYVLSTMGTGKTRAAIFAADWLMRTAGAARWLIVAPLSTLTPVWEQELFRVLPRARVRILYGTRAQRLKLLAEDADYYVVNHHGLNMLNAELLKKCFHGVIIDELAVFRNRQSILWKSANAIINSTGLPPAYAWGLTGSPTPNAPTDAWAQVRLLTPSRVARTATAFREQTMQAVAPFKWIARPNANAIVHAAMQPSVRFNREDIMELPDTTHIDRKIALGDDVVKAYDMMTKKMRVMMTNGQSITAVNEGVLRTKLLQVALGYVYTDNGTTYTLPSTERLEALNEIIEQCDRKLIVFVPFVHALEGIATYLRKKGHDIATVFGETPTAARNSIFSKFQDPDHPLRVLVAHPRTMAHGLTLVTANTVVWYGPMDDLDIYEQANARITRPGQTSKTFITHLWGSLVEKMVYARLKAKSRMQGLLLEMFKQQELDF